MRRGVIGVTVGAAAAVAVAGALWGAQRKLIYFPTQDLPDVALVAPDVEEVSFTTGDGVTLDAWMVPAADPAHGVTVAVFHGNGGNRADRLPLARALSAEGFGVLLVDYRGYGGNPGSPSEEGLLADARAAVAYLRSRPDVDAGRIAYFGESLGAGVAIALAEEDPPTALVLRSPFASLSDVAAVHYPYLPTRLLRDRYRNVETIRGIGVPVLVVAGSRDTIVPIAQSREVYAAAPGAKRFVTIEGADHNDPELTAGDRLIDEVVAFLTDPP